MLAALRGWSGRCEAVLADLDAHIARVHTTAKDRARSERAAGEKMAKALADARETDRKGGGAGREGLARRAMNKRSIPDSAAKIAADEVMDLDGPFTGEDGKKRASKRKM